MSLGVDSMPNAESADMNWKQNESEDAIVHPALHEGDGAIARRRFFSGATKLPGSIEVWELEPGTSEGRHVHEGEDALEEFYYFIAGEGVMWMDDEEVQVRAGDAVMAPPGVDHGFRCVGDNTLKLVIAWGKPRQ